jgi:nucleotide-binding universal stress UspA family protein
MKDHRILVPLDGSVLAECVLPHVVAVGKVFDSSITLLRVLSPAADREKNQVIDPIAWEMKKAEAVSYLKEIKEHLDQELPSVDYHFFEGNPAEKILEFARQNPVDLIALSSHGKSGLHEWNISSVVQKIIMQCQKSVLLVRAYHAINVGLADIRYQELAALLDCSKRAELVLPVISAIARFYKSRLLLTHIIRETEIICPAPPPKEEQDLANMLTEINRRYATSYLQNITVQMTNQDLDARSRIEISNKPTETMHTLMDDENIELVMLTAHGITGSQKWPYGSLAASFFLYGSIPVIILQDLKPEQIEASKAEIAAKEYKGH